MNRKLVIIVIVLLTGLVSIALAQRYTNKPQTHETMSHNSMATPQMKEDPLGTIDGSKTPELISDSKAYEVFCHSIAVPSAASDSEKRAAKDKLRRAQLSSKDIELVMKTLSEFYSERIILAGTDNQLRSQSADDAEFKKLQAEEISLISKTQDKFKTRLSSEGAAKLNEYVMGLKQKIKLLPIPKM